MNGGAPADRRVAGRRLRDNQPAMGDQLRETNEQLVLSMLRTQAAAAAAAQDIAFREQTTQLRLENQRLGEENRVMHEASRLKSQFLANMSHELRTPLNAVIGFSELLRSGTVAPDSPKYPIYLDHINTSGKLLLRLITDLLNLSKAASEELEFHPAPVNLAQAVQKALDFLEGEIRRRHVTVQVDIDPDVDALFLDPARLHQVLVNYLSNAVKFSHEGGRVTLRARAEGSARVRVEVEDRGIGIAAERQAHLFAAFEQAESGNTRRYQGAGIGLANARMLVEAQGGSVGARSQLGEGSTFHFVLDRHPELAIEAQPTRTARAS